MNQPPVTAEDLYLYAMHLLDEEEHARLDAFLLQSPEAQAELIQVRGDIALFALGTEQQEPPPAARQRLLNQVAHERKAFEEPALAAAAVPAAHAVTSPAALQATPAATYTPSEPAPMRLGQVDDAEPRRGFFSFVFPWAGWAVAAGLAVSTGMLYQRQQGLQDQVTFARASAATATANSARAQTVLETLRSQSAQRFVLAKQTTQPQPSARVTYLAENGSLVFEGSHIESLPANKTYELWLIPKGEGAKPIPAGTFRPDERGFASVILPQLPKGVEAGAFGVTMEDEGGSQTPTLPILMVGS